MRARTRTVLVLPAADQDLRTQTDYLAENAGVDVALRFYDAARETFEQLAEMPQMGVQVENRVLPDLRRWRVRDFEKILIFYRFDETTLLIVRILHGARDLDSLFDPA
jgi:toxin ParE1/3/4